MGLLLLHSLGGLPVGLGNGPPLALEAELPDDKGEDEDEGDAADNAAGYGTDIGLRRRGRAGGGIDCAVDGWAGIASLGGLDADLASRADEAFARERQLLALDAALAEPEDALDVWACQSTKCGRAPGWGQNDIPLRARADMAAVAGSLLDETMALWWLCNAGGPGMTGGGDRGNGRWNGVGGSAQRKRRRPVGARNRQEGGARKTRRQQVTSDGGEQQRQQHHEGHGGTKR